MNSPLILPLLVTACVVACAPDAELSRESEQVQSSPRASVVVSSGGSDARDVPPDTEMAADTLEQARHYLNYRYVPGSEKRLHVLGGSLLERVDGGEYAIWLVVSGDTSMIWISRLVEGAAPDRIPMRWAFRSLWEVRDARILPEQSEDTELSFGGFCSDSLGVRRKDIVAIIPAAAVGSDVVPISAWAADAGTERIAATPVDGLVCRVSREGG